MFQDYWKLVLGNTFDHPGTEYCSYRVDWKNYLAQDFGGSIEDWQRLFATKQRLWNESITCASFRAVLQKIATHQRVKKVVCFGLGDMARRPPETTTLPPQHAGKQPEKESDGSFVDKAMMQHAMAITLAEELGRRMVTATRWFGCSPKTLNTETTPKSSSRHRASRSSETSAPVAFKKLMINLSSSLVGPAHPSSKSLPTSADPLRSLPSATMEWSSTVSGRVNLYGQLAIKECLLTMAAQSAVCGWTVAQDETDVAGLRQMGFSHIISRSRTNDGIQYFEDFYQTRRLRSQRFHGLTWPKTGSIIIVEHATRESHVDTCCVHLLSSFASKRSMVVSSCC